MARRDRPKATRRGSYYGLGRRVAALVGCSPEYVSRVLNGRVGDTALARRVKAAIESEMKAIESEWGHRE